MAQDFITINESAPLTHKFAGDLKRFVDHLRNVIDEAEKIKGIMEHNINDTNYGGVETLFGLSAGTGDDCYNLIAGTLGAIKGVIQSADALTLIDQVG
jgi:hypothetical protein